ncbi:MAG: AMP-binding protein, partial [Natronomonas sp.]
MVAHSGADEVMTLEKFYTGLFERHEERTALVDGHRELTYAELDEQSARFANVLDSVGLGSGDLVGILLGNRSEYVVTQIVAARAGVVAVPFNYQIDRSTIKPILEETDIRTLVVGPEHLETIQELRDGPLDFNHLIGIADQQKPPLG